MPTSRLCGASRMTSLVPNRMLPASGRMNPASTISSVVLPDPEGPSSVRNSPLCTSRSTWSSATTLPYDLATPRTAIGTEAARVIAAPPESSTRAMPRPALLGQHVLIQLRGPGLVLDVPVEVDCNLLRRVVRVGRQALRVGGVDRPEVVRLPVGGTVRDVLRELRLVLRLADLGQELHCRRLVRRILRDREAVV